MTDAEVTVTLTDTEFTLGELEDFVAQARATDGITLNALVVVKMPNVTAMVSSGPVQFELSASSAYRQKQ